MDDPMRKARRLAELIGNGLTQEKAAAKCGFRKRSTASKYLALLKLPAVWQSRVSDGLLGISAAGQIARAAAHPQAMAQLSKLWEASHAADASRDVQLSWPTSAVRLADLVDEFTARPRRRVARAKRFDPADEAACWALYRSIPRRHWAALSGCSGLHLRRQQDLYGVPLAGETIDLEQVARWLRSFLAEFRVLKVAWALMVPLRDRRRNLLGAAGNWRRRKSQIAGDWLAQMRQMTQFFQEEIREVERDGHASDEPGASA